jgi:RHS repeat-associated protein
MPTATPPSQGAWASRPPLHPTFTASTTASSAAPSPDGKTIDLTYNPDGHRLTKFITQNGLTQRLVHNLTDANNPTGYAQVIEEKQPLEASNQRLNKVHLYGHDLISSLITDHSALITKPIFYTYDGLGSVRSITTPKGDLQETYDYDAYGTLIGLAKRNPTTSVLESSNLSSTIPNPQSEFLFTDEQWDEDLGIYFLRARYLNTNTDRFHSQDSYEGRNGEPLTLHKYLYSHGNPVMFTDPSGNVTLTEQSAVIGMMGNFASMTARVGTFLRIVDTADTVITLIETLKNTFDLISSGQLSTAFKDSLRESRGDIRKTYNLDEVTASLADNYPRILKNVFSRWIGYLTKHVSKVDGFVIYMPNPTRGIPVKNFTFLKYKRGAKTFVWILHSVEATKKPGDWDGFYSK